MKPINLKHDHPGSYTAKKSERLSMTINEIENWINQTIIAANHRTKEESMQHIIDMRAKKR